MSGIVGGEGSKSGTIGPTRKADKPGFMAYHCSGDINYSGQVMPFGSGTNGSVNGGKQFDTLNNFDNTTNFRFTAPVAGVYLFTAQCNANPTSNSGVSRARWRINGGSIGAGIHFRGHGGINRTAQDLHQLSYTVILNLQKNDYVDVYAFDNQFDLFGANSMSGHLIS